MCACVSICHARHHDMRICQDLGVHLKVPVCHNGPVCACKCAFVCVCVCACVCVFSKVCARAFTSMSSCE